jgi:hypothetical protein
MAQTNLLDEKYYYDNYILPKIFDRSTIKLINNGNGPAQRHNNIFDINISNFIWINNPDDYYLAVNQKDKLRIFELQKYQKDILIKATSLPLNTERTLQVKDDNNNLIDIKIFNELLDGNVEPILSGYKLVTSPEKYYFVRKDIKSFNDDMFIDYYKQVANGEYQAYYDSNFFGKAVLTEYPPIYKADGDYIRKLRPITLTIINNADDMRMINYDNDRFVVSTLKSHHKNILHTQRYIIDIQLKALVDNCLGYKFLYDYIDNNGYPVKVWIFGVGGDIYNNRTINNAKVGPYCKFFLNGYFSTDQGQQFPRIFLKTNETINNMLETY